MMAMNDQTLETRLETFKDSDAQRNQLLVELIAKLGEFERVHGDLIRDYDNERKSRRQWQDSSDALERELQSVRQATENHSFVQVLIDGDAAYFYENYIKDGKCEKGGQNIAAQLHTELRKHIDSLFPGVDLPIILHMYANLGGLSSLYVRSKVIPSPSGLYVFARGFNSGSDMFHLVDVGTGKEGADHKVREMLRTFLGHRQCKHLIFAGCHDNGYLNVLRPLSHDPDKCRRITLLETIPAQPGFRDLGFDMITLPSIFKTEQLKTAGTSTVPQALPVRSPIIGGNGPISWSSKAATSGPEIFDVSSTKTKPKYYIMNADRQRIDDRLPPIPQSAIYSYVERRKEEGPACNEYYLLGHCAGRNSTCSYQHHYKLSPGELTHLRHLARNISCPDLGFCEDETCYKGHVCPTESKGKTCTKGEDCYFYQMHGVDLNPAIRVYADGKEERIGS